MHPFLPGPMDLLPLICIKCNVRNPPLRFSHICNPLSFVPFPELGSMSVAAIVNEMRRIHDQAYQLGVQEAKEMTRGKYLNIFGANAWRKN